MDRAVTPQVLDRQFPWFGWLGLAMVLVFWALNWSLEGLRTQWGFFPLWLGYCLAVDGVNVYRRGTSLLTRGSGRFFTLFLISAPIWWSFELVNWRTQNWQYLGREFFTDLEYLLLASLSFSTVVPAVLGTAELFAGTSFVRRLQPGPRLSAGLRTTRLFFLLGLGMFIALMIWPRYFFPFTWTFMVFLIEPINAWWGNRSLFQWTDRRDWRPLVALALGVLTCGFFWELWNYFSFPKWVYAVPFFGFWHLFEMPLLGYLGYIPFALELLAIVHLVLGIAGRPRSDYVMAGLAPDGGQEWTAHADRSFSAGGARSNASPEKGR